MTGGSSPAAEGDHERTRFDRRDFLKTAVVGGAAAAGGTAAIVTPELRRPNNRQPAAMAGYAFLNLDEAACVEALVDHMIPADEVSPKGTDLGVNIYIDRALAGAWGKGERLYMHGPWKLGAPSQGYQLPTPAQLYRAGNRGDQRTLPQGLRQNVRPDRGRAAPGGADRPVRRQDHLRQRTAGAGVLDDAVPDRDRRHLFRPDLRRQSCRF
jgi:Gluconate 2-dehydrogenase subunit 3/TAT (twin-arginine translocation) pathway signal sequence